MYFLKKKTGVLFVLAVEFPPAAQSRGESLLLRQFPAAQVADNPPTQEPLASGNSIQFRCRKDQRLHSGWRASAVMKTDSDVQRIITYTHKKCSINIPENYVLNTVSWSKCEPMLVNHFPVNHLYYVQ